MLRCAVLGDPIAHSLSPVLHRAGYAATGLDWEYDAVRVPEVEFTDFVRGLDGGWRGLSLTMPLKRKALGLAGSVTARAALAAAANTLLLEDGVVVLADNTDLPGAAAAVRERYDGPVRTATVLGGGATAASTGLAMVDLGATSVRLLVRSPDRATEAADAIAAHPSGPSVEVGSLADSAVAGDVVVSTIPAAAQDEGLVARCAEVPVVFEVIYDPWPTPIAASAGDRVLVSGLDLLAHQAVLQFELFTGVPGPLDVMRSAGAAELAERHRA
ncbi:shikimate dehydrogenase [Nocardioides sp. Root1257]|uniref:shikimate dehydrogenase n=1 Tax=unclassified Nocardioides TaxID=2615069 RepID=UPI0006F24DDB|nr:MULTISPECIES: shikimate dehydrogenase [unclassified Nocardioides]KQW43060.1 shikimate dehydrogenase [Nocardioides sp. Root1257]KRC41928.1 shikimate dehydrogenase [Nocardioides sp. Root224]